MTHRFQTTRRTLAILAAGTALMLGAAQAQTAAPAASATSVAAPAAQRLTIRDIYDRLDTAGYRDIREIELDDGRYEAKATNAKGERVKLKLNAASGAVERERAHR